MKKESFTSFMKQVAVDLQQSGNLGTAHVYRSTLNAILTFQGSGCLSFPEITPEWLKHFEGSLRARGCSWNTVSTYLRTMRAVYNRAVDLHRAPYVPHLFRSVYTGTRADRRRALDMEDMKKTLNRTGLIHIAFSVGSKEKVDELTMKLEEAGYPVVSGPRTTGDGYYESCVVAIEENQIEITV